jgi:hypothetical protein
VLTVTLTADRPSTKTERVLSAKLEQELLKHPGKWIAMTPDAIVAVGDDSIEVYKAARDAGVMNAILYRVPETGTSYFY